MADTTRSLNTVRTFIESSRGLDPERRMKFYDTWAETYEKDSEMLDYRAPALVVEFLAANFPESRENVRVLDVACGSGLVGKLMSELGFKHFVGVDGSKGMLDLAAQSGVYQDLRQALLGTEPLPAETGAFDLVAIIGALRPDFVPVSVLRELHQAAKPGGLICMSRVDPKSEAGAEYRRCMERELRLMEEEGLWTPVATAEMDRYMVDVYNQHTQVEGEEKEQYLSGTIYLYRSSVNESLHS
ncbi:methyltransferase-like protein 27 [Halichoeres trimaculatus]|uniref:methyltransferase-like protein 27 n=1 Tax=Halichoeres trimaculatus TaxID=147232 RepID=UPI003D9E14A0